MTVEPVALAGHREVVVRDDGGRVSRHFVILCFAARWIAGEPKLNEELAEARWLRPAELDGPQDHRRPGRDRRRRLRAHGSGRLSARPSRRTAGRGDALAALRPAAAWRICPTTSMLKRAFTIALVAATVVAAALARAANAARSALDRRRPRAVRRRLDAAGRNPRRAALSARALRRQRGPEMARRDAGPARSRGAERRTAQPAWWRTSTAAIAASSRPTAPARRPPTSRCAAISTKAPRFRAKSPRATPTDRCR